MEKDKKERIAEFQKLIPKFDEIKKGGSKPKESVEIQTLTNMIREAGSRVNVVLISGNKKHMEDVRDSLEKEKDIIKVTSMMNIHDKDAQNDFLNENWENEDVFMVFMEESYFSIPAW